MLARRTESASRTSTRAVRAARARAPRPHRAARAGQRAAQRTRGHPAAAALRLEGVERGGEAVPRSAQSARADRAPNRRPALERCGAYRPRDFVRAAPGRASERTVARRAREAARQHAARARAVSPRAARAAELLDELGVAAPAVGPSAASSTVSVPAERRADSPCAQAAQHEAVAGQDRHRLGEVQAGEPARARSSSGADRRDRGEPFPRCPRQRNRRGRVDRGRPRRAIRRAQSIVVVGAIASGVVRTARAEHLERAHREVHAQRIPGNTSPSANPGSGRPRKRARRSSGKSVTASADAQRRPRPISVPVTTARSRATRRQRSTGRRGGRVGVGARIGSRRELGSVPRSTSSPARSSDDTRTIGAPRDRSARAAPPPHPPRAPPRPRPRVDLGDRYHGARDAESSQIATCSRVCGNHALVRGDHEQHEIDAAAPDTHRAHEPLVARTSSHPSRVPPGRSSGAKPSSIVIQRDFSSGAGRYRRR